NTLNDHDKAWLQQTLNGNQSLLDAVDTFHDDATQSYLLWGQAGSGGKSISAADTAKVSQLADSSFYFMSMFQRAGTQMLNGMDPQGSYVTSAGAPIDFHQSVNSALGFLVFQKSTQSIAQGTNSYTDTRGHTHYGELKGDVSSLPGVIPSFAPPESNISLGLNAVA
ncbi:hypothetical protein, partial [Dyella sp.]|uniref:hypothetical protein n=1 Tax=Dyella sp. TaxID=1869338 RepID=UPI002ED3FE39